MHQQLSLAVIAGRYANPLKMYLHLISPRRLSGRCLLPRYPGLKRMQITLKTKTFKSGLRRLIILIIVFDIKLFRARNGGSERRDTCNFVSFSASII